MYNRLAFAAHNSKKYTALYDAFLMFTSRLCFNQIHQSIKRNDIEVSLKWNLLLFPAWLMDAKNNDFYGGSLMEKV